MGSKEIGCPDTCAKCMTVLALWEDKLGSKPWPQVTRLAGRYGDIMHKFFYASDQGCRLI